MKITEEQVAYVAQLARLEVSPEERARFSEQLSSILDYVEKLNELDTEDVEPTSHVLPITNVMDEDAVKASLSREASLANAPDQEGGLLRVPKIIE